MKISIPSRESREYQIKKIIEINFVNFEQMAHRNMKFSELRKISLRHTIKHTYISFGTPLIKFWINLINFG
jgi:hypothetical protein